MPNIYTEYNDERVKQFHWGADPCRLRMQTFQTLQDHQK